MDRASVVQHSNCWKWKRRYERTRVIPLSSSMLSSTSSDFTVTRPSLQLHAAFPSHQIYYFHFHCLREWCLWHSSAVHTIRATQTKDPLYAYLIQFYSGHISAIITKSIKIIPQCRSENVYRRGVWELGVEWAALPPMSTQIPLRSQIPTKVFVKFFFSFRCDLVKAHSCYRLVHHSFEYFLFTQLQTCSMFISREIATYWILGTRTTYTLQLFSVPFSGEIQ